MKNSEQQFLDELDKKLWAAADRLRNNLDAANYKHVVLGIIFLKYVSDAFEERQQELRVLFTQDNSDDNIYFMPREDYESVEEYQDAVNAELELHEYYQEKNVFWVPKRSRWEYLKNTAALPIGSELWLEHASREVSPEEALLIREKHKDSNSNEEKQKDPITIKKLTSISWLIDHALEAIETYKINDKLANPKLKGVLPRISRYEVDNHNLTELINRFSDTSFRDPEYNGEKLDLHSKDILGHVYEYFLGQFALAEGKQGGQYYTPKSIVTLIVEMLQPYQGRVYDPAMGAGGFFVSNDKFIQAHAADKHYNATEQRKHISVYGQESNPTTWKLAAMNMAIRGIDFNFGKKNADTFLDDQHPDLRADYVMANPPFNIKDWWHAKLEGDIRWKYGTPPQGNANYGWIQHMLHHLNDNGSMALLLANGSMSSNTNNEGEIRKSLIEADLVECMVALPGQLFTNTQIPACIWFLTKSKKSGNSKRDRRGETLFIDARNLGFMQDRVLRDFTNEDISKIADVFHDWQSGTSYQNEKGFCFSAKREDMQKHDYLLTPGRYVGSADAEEDSEPFQEKMQRLTARLKSQFEESDRLEKAIKDNLMGIGYEL
ncbi:restriction endonuclease subunit M [Aliidiomarina sedimenti]|uniref:site-specific DNA-methyltransferase (adenine-specific) n=1 Tax=Aliidiomarina sedimenti TaxID=1933879 RepID=A0ABY0BXT3_9GAMM|nr:type I restriction-modification system subunit M [Aliidiomarina sedimenti]RUO29232.1 restriction endonuclease subunit M [Aliidiomarina sedimenti]